MLNYKLATSPTRRYVAQCYKINFDGFYFRSFTLPGTYENNAEGARSYYMGKLKLFSYVKSVFPLEDYQDIKEKKDL